MDNPNVTIDDYDIALDHDNPTRDRFDEPLDDDHDSACSTSTELLSPSDLETMPAQILRTPVTSPIRHSVQILLLA